MSGIIVRTFQAGDDLAAVLALLHRAFGALKIDPPSGALRETVETLRARLPADVLLLAHSGDKLVGCVLCAPEEGAFDLGRLAVDPGLQRQGIGRALIKAACAEARRRGITRMTLGVRKMLDGNVRFFESCGFVVVGETTHEGYAAPTSYRMERAL